VNLNDALQLTQGGQTRQKRNIIGSLLSSLTGLVTREGMHGRCNSKFTIEVEMCVVWGGEICATERDL
jgi:hypothetical protein